MSKALPVIITFVIAGAGGFFGGMQYQKTRLNSVRQNFGGQNLTQEQRDQMRQQFAGQGGGLNGGARGGLRLNGGGAAVGEIIAKDGTSITVKLQDGGSKIVFYATSTDVGKFDKGSTDDLAIGANVFISGKANDDGSITAQNIQIRPLVTLPPEAE